MGRSCSTTALSRARAGDPLATSPTHICGDQRTDGATVNWRVRSLSKKMVRRDRGVYEAGPARLPIVARSVRRSTERPDTLAQTVSSIRTDAVAWRGRTIHSLRQIAAAFLAQDESQLEYYEQITKAMPGRVLGKHGLVQRDGDGYRLTPDVSALTAEERTTLLAACDKAVRSYLERRGEAAYDHRRQALGHVPGSLRYEVLQRAGFRCELYTSERRTIDRLLEEARAEILKRDPAVSGFNIGSNNGAAAGQTIFHYHVHLIPRRRGDVEKPQGGVRGIIPGMADYGSHDGGEGKADS